MIPDWPGLIHRHASGRVLLDANLLLLRLVDLHGPAALGQCRRTQQFARDDAVLLQRLLARFGGVVTTAHILAEVNSLAGIGFPRALRPAVFATFAAVIEVLEERSIPSIAAARQDEFRRFGLTDTVLIELARERLLVVTVDGALALHLASRHLPVLNFNHLRPMGWR